MFMIKYNHTRGSVIMVHYNFDTEKIFNIFINEFNEIKNKILNNIELEIIKYNNLKESINNKDIDLLLNDDSLFNDAVINSLKIIKYLTSNNVTDVPQYKEAIKDLNSYIEVCENKIDIFNNDKLRISDIDLGTIGLDDLRMFLNNSSLKENDRLNILFDIAYSNKQINYNVNELTENIEEESLDKEESNKNIEEEEEILDIPDNNEIEIFSIPEDILSIAKELIEKNKYIIEENSSRLSMIRKSQYFWIDSLKENIDLTGIDNNTKLEILLYKLIDLVNSSNTDELNVIIDLFNKIKAKVNI